MPFNVQTMGISKAAANSRNSGTAFAIPTPPPTYNIGFLAACNNARAAATSSSTKPSNGGNSGNSDTVSHAISAS